MPFEAGTIWSFSSGDMPPEERAASVRSLRERGILHLKPLPDLTARVEITKYALPGVKILAGTLSGLLQIGNPNDPGGQDDLFLGINLTSKSTFANLAGKSSSVAAKRPFFVHRRWVCGLPTDAGVIPRLIICLDGLGPERRGQAALVPQVSASPEDSALCAPRCLRRAGIATRLGTCAL